MGPHPAVAAIRLAVRRTLHDLLAELAGAGTPGTSSPPASPSAP
ncbi:tRNA lysidine(34) synthetase TilS, partial [Streptomyces sp. SID5475]|nr:tRNA lysidine(34) synthetase TilS [Streptomyces sp. SID5475]